MASLRCLPSGRWQASVLLDDGTRTTKTFDSQAKAAAWGVEAEVERDRVRAEKRAEGEDLRAAALVASLKELADQGRLTKQDAEKLSVILKTVT